MLWKRRSRSCIERTGDDVCVGRRRCGVVFGTIGVTTGLESVLLCASVEAEGRGVFDGADDGVGGRDTAVAY